MCADSSFFRIFLTQMIRQCCLRLEGPTAESITLKLLELRGSNRIAHKFLTPQTLRFVFPATMTPFLSAKRRADGSGREPERRDGDCWGMYPFVPRRKWGSRRACLGKRWLGLRCVVSRWYLARLEEVWGAGCLGCRSAFC